MLLFYGRLTGQRDCDRFIKMLVKKDPTRSFLAFIGGHKFCSSADFHEIRRFNDISWKYYDASWYHVSVPFPRHRQTQSIRVFVWRWPNMNVPMLIYRIVQTSSRIWLLKLTSYGATVGGTGPRVCLMWAKSNLLRTCKLIAQRYEHPVIFLFCIIIFFHLRQTLFHVKN